jgi:uncharacterized membrane protein YGL010W
MEDFQPVTCDDTGPVILVMFPLFFLDRTLPLIGFRENLQETIGFSHSE